MNTDVRSAEEDLAFLRGVVERSDGAPGWGESYFAAGLIYGAQMLMHAGQLFGLLPTSGLGAVAIGVGPSVVFLPVLAFVLWRHRGDQPPAAVGRAIAAAFSGIGAANLALIVIIGWSALKERSLAIWLIYPACVFLLQGAAWTVAWIMRRRAWHGLVAGGWFAYAIAMGLTTDRIAAYLLFCGLGIWTCMALPGWLMLRGASKPAA